MTQNNVVKDTSVLNFRIFKTSKPVERNDQILQGHQLKFNIRFIINKCRHKIKKGTRKLRNCVSLKFELSVDFFV